MFTLPTFNLSCDIWWNYQAGVSLYAIPDLAGVPCNLSPGKRTFFYTPTIFQTPCFFFPMELLLPPFTDIRSGDIPSGANGLVEVPKASFRFYQVTYVDDIGKGFANEHRFAIVHRYNDVVMFADIAPVNPPWPLP